MPKAIDITGQRFHRLIALHATSQCSTDGIVWECLCDCGNRTKVGISKLRSGHTKSCGCFKINAVTSRSTKHGCAPRRNQTSTYRCWGGIIKRCTNPRDKRFEHYGGRGITVCDRWRDFRNFLADMGERPSGYSIERIDVNGHYEPSNCKWIPMIEQCRNTKRVIHITIGDETRLLADWARHFGIDYRLVSARLKRGWSIGDAFTV